MILKLFWECNLVSVTTDLIKEQSYCLSDAAFFLCNCVVPENIQNPTTEGISHRTPPPPWIFHFCRELITPHPLGISTSVTKTPQPLWKSSFSSRKSIKVKEPFMISTQRFPSEARMVLFPFI